AEQMVRSTLAELLILDIGLPLRRGIAVLERLRADGYALPVLFFSMYPAAQYADAARKAGAQGFVGKEASAGELLQAVYQVLAGGSSFATGASAPGKAGQGSNNFDALSTRERQVLQGLLAGTSLLELSLTLHVSTKTLSTYRTRLLNKLGVHSNAELVALAICHGYL
ncbi:MAG: response regulator transcription factor, partial [Rhodoferax sp.]|nr:response regulator transcription factor [Rhodoferax sp.]